jgi:DNA adenine methylase
MSKQLLQKPFLKWVGGKTQIIDAIIDKLPKEMNNYHELFLGGGSVLFAVLSLQKQNTIVIKNKIYAYDINKHLIDVYRTIQHNKDSLFEYITAYMNEYDGITGAEINRKPTNIQEAKTSKESYYYWLRSKYNKMSNENIIERSALFMIINKTCFRGMYREGPNGYNVPYGHYKTTPTIITKTELNNISELIQNVEFVHSDFISSIKNAKRDDFVYLDPPYAPENSKSFVGYVADGFSLETHKRLFDEVKKMGNNNIKFVMSNAKVDLVTDYFKDYKQVDILARRAINSKNPGATATEVMIYT